MTSIPIPAGQVTYVTQGNVINVPLNSGTEKHAKTFVILGVSYM